MISEATKTSLVALGQRLREARIAHGDTQVSLAARLGVSPPTVRKLEVGDPGATLGLLAEALDLLGRLSDLDGLLAPPEDLFSRVVPPRKPRQRLGRKR